MAALEPILVILLRIPRGVSNIQRKFTLGTDPQNLRFFFFFQENLKKKKKKQNRSLGREPWTAD